MYRVFDGNTWREFSKYSYLLNWLSMYNVAWGNYRNTFLNRVGVNPGDTYYAGFMGEDSTFVGYLTRAYRIQDEYGNNLYCEKLVQDVLTYHYSKDEYIEWNNEVWSRRHREDYPEFRRGPWPYIHHPRKMSIYRNIRTMNEKRQTTGKEVERFSRGTRGKNLPSCWDEVAREWRNKGWKAQGKARHQWENKTKLRSWSRYGKGLYVYKGEYKEHTDFEDENMEEIYNIEEDG